MNATAIIAHLQEGNERFVAEKPQNPLRDLLRRHALEAGQSPPAIVLSCADSRVAPELAFDAGLGELFVVRVAGNVANSSSIASIEYAVAHCGSRLIVVMGHQGCGAVAAALKGGDHGRHINGLLSHIAPAIVAAGPGADATAVIKQNARLAAEALQTHSPLIRDAVAQGRVKVVAAYYHLGSGKVEFLNS